MAAEKTWYDGLSMAEAGYSGALASIERDWIAASGAAGVALQASIGTACGQKTRTNVLLFDNLVLTTVDGRNLV